MRRLFAPLILRQLRREPLRTAITVVGVAAGIAVVLAIRLTNASAVRGFDAALELTSGRAGLEIIGPPGGVAEALLPSIDWLREYGGTSPVIDGDALVQVGRGGRSELVRILGVDILRDYPIRDYEVGEGERGGSPRSALDILALLTDPSAAVITRAFADRHGLSVGDPLPVLISDRPKVLRVRGLLEAEGPAKLLDGNFVLMDLAAAQWAFERLGGVDRLDVKLHDGVDVATAEREIAARLPRGLTVQRPERRSQQVEQMLGAFQLNLTALSSIALLVGLFLVYNAVSVSVLARRQEIGTVRALGVTRRQVRWLFLGEALVFGVLGVAAGVPLARALATVTVALTSRTVSSLYVATAAAAPSLSWSDVLVAVLVGVPLSLLAAWLPASEAAGVPPTAILRGADRALARSSSQTPSRLTGVALLVAALALSQMGPIAGLPIAGYLASIALVLGAALLMPALLQVTARRGRLVWHRLFGVAGWLAHAALGGAIGRVAVSVAALAVSLAMMVAITIMVASFRQTVIDWVGQSLKADLFVGPATRRSSARAPVVSRLVEDAVRSHPEVLAIDAFHSTTVPYANSLVFMGAGDFAVQARFGGLQFTSGEAADTVLGRARASGDAVIVSEPFSNRYGRRVGDRVDLPTPAGPVSFEVVGVYVDYSSDRGVVMMDTTTLSRHFGAQRPTGLTVYLRDGRRAGEVRAQLLDRLDGSAGVFIYTNRSLREEVLRIFDSTFAITYALQAVAITVALLGIVGTLMTLVIERRRDLSILRAVGAARRQLRTMVMAEAVILGIISQAAGLTIGVLLALILIYVVNLQSFGWTIHLTIPWLSLMQMSALVVLATLLAGLYPAQRATQAPGVLLEDE